MDLEKISLFSSLSLQSFLNPPESPSQLLFFTSLICFFHFIIQIIQRCPAPKTNIGIREAVPIFHLSFAFRFFFFLKNFGWILSPTSVLFLFPSSNLSFCSLFEYFSLLSHMFDWEDEFIIESYRVPWLIWVQLLVTILLVVVLVFGFGFFASDLSNNPNCNSASSSSSSFSSNRSQSKNPLQNVGSCSDGSKVWI